MKWLTLALVGAIAACSANTSQTPSATASSVGSPRAALENHRTFTFAPANPPAAGYETTARSLEVQRRLAPLVRASLEQRGYKEKTDSPDLLVKLSSGSGTLPGDEAYASISGNTNIGFIGVDIYDRASGADVWHGSAHAEIDPRRIDKNLLARGVEEMMAGFPAR